MKRIWLLLALVLCLAALPLAVSAEEAEQPLSKEEVLIQSTRDSYTKSLASAGRDDFSGFCGLMTSHQLYNMGINETLVVKDGNKQFDHYSTVGITDAGYHVAAYPSSLYSLEEALNYITKNGTRDVYNMIVGFQWTNTEAGHIYGHACVINGIIDGTVYFVESFYTMLGGEEGNVVRCTIPEFASIFDDWTTYEGLIHFGDYSVVCQEYETDAYLRTRFDTVLRSQPELLGKGGCVRLRSIAGGELLHASALVQTPDERMFYRIHDGSRTGYVPATAVIVSQLSGEGLSLEDLDLPETLEAGQDADISGTVRAEYGALGSVEVCITDNKNAIALRERLPVAGSRQSLTLLNEELYLDLLSAGTYRLEIYADSASTVVWAGKLQTRYQRVLLASARLQVGKRKHKLSQPEAQSLDGWVRNDGKWYCYRMGEPATGWVSSRGVKYYLDDTGAAVTGWQEIDGLRRYFSHTGAMCVGWLTEPEGTYYLDDTGTAVVGWWENSGKKYYFNEQGLLQTKGEMADGDVIYVFAPDGIATEKEEKH